MFNRQWPFWPWNSPDQTSIFRIVVVNVLEIFSWLFGLFERTVSTTEELFEGIRSELKMFSSPWRRKIYRFEPHLDRTCRNLTDFLCEMSDGSEATFDDLYNEFDIAYERELKKRKEERNPHMPVFSWSSYVLHDYLDLGVEYPYRGVLHYPEFLISVETEDNDSYCDVKNFEGASELEGALSREVVESDIPELRPWEVELVLEYDRLFQVWRSEIRRYVDLLAELFLLSQDPCYASTEDLRRHRAERRTHARRLLV